MSAQDIFKRLAADLTGAVAATSSLLFEGSAAEAEAARILAALLKLDDMTISSFDSGALDSDIRSDIEHWLNVFRAYTEARGS